MKYNNEIIRPKHIYTEWVWLAAGKIIFINIFENINFDKTNFRFMRQRKSYDIIPNK